MNFENIWEIATVMFGILSFIGAALFVICFNLAIYKRDKRIEKKAHEILRQIQAENENFEISSNSKTEEEDESMCNLISNASEDEIPFKLQKNSLNNISNWEAKRHYRIPKL